MPTLTFRPFVAAPALPAAARPGPRLFVAVPGRLRATSPGDPATVRGEWQTIHAVADRLRPLMEAVVESAFEEMAAAVDMREFASAIATADPERALAALPWDLLEARLLRIEPILRVSFLAGGEVGAYYLDAWPEAPKAAAEDVESLARDPLVAVMSMLGPKYKGRMDLLNPRAVEWLKQHATKLIKDDITPESKKAIKEILVAAFEEGWGAPAATARRILPYVGLSSPLARAVHNYELGLAEKGVDADKAQGMVEKYALRLRRYRARIIARTETLAASNAGQREIWNQAGERGFLDLAESQRKWIITPDDRLCFPAGTMVATDAGEQPIETLAVGHMVMTPVGPRRVVRTFRRSYRGDLVVIRTGKRVCAMTGNHPVWSRGGWVEARNLKLGDPLQTLNQQPACVDAVVHLILRDMNDGPSKRGESCVSSGILDGIPVPVFSICLDDDARGQQREIDTEGPYLQLLHEVQAHLFQCLPDTCLDDALATGESVAPEAAIDLGVGGAGDHSELLPTMPAAFDDGGAPTFLGAELARATFVAEQLATTRACAVCGCDPSALQRAHGVAMGYGCGDGECLAADGTDLVYHLRSGCTQVAGPAAEAPMSEVQALSRPDDGAARLTRSSLGVDSTCLVVAGSGAIHGLGNAFVSDNLYPASGTDVSKGHGLYLATIMAELYRARQVTVYNLEVEGEHVYFANGILVHNCPICKLMTGQIVPANQPFKTPVGGSIENPPLHPACRCAQGLSRVAPPKAAPAAAPPPPGAFPWRESELTPVSINLEGAHPKQVFEAPDGSRWLFKPDETAALAEIAGYRLMRELGLDAPDAYLVTIRGKIGSVQKMWPDVASPVRIDALASLTREQIEQIQRHQVADWLMSQHDTNNGALLLSASGKIYAIDKGQALKFFGRDRLDWTYNPNPERLVYNRLFEDHIAGRIALDRAAIAPMLARARALPDARLREIFRPYAEHAVRMGWVRTPEEILDKLVARKASLEADFDELYRRADAERERRPGGRAERPHTAIDQAFADDVRRQGWAGRSIMVAGPELEDAHILAYEIRKGAARTLVLEAKVREPYEGKVLQAMGPAARAAGGPSVHPRDDMWEAQLLPAIKHVAFHMKPGGDGVVTPAKVAGLQAAAKKLVDMSAAMPASKKVPGDPDFEMLKHYSSMIQQVTGRTPLEVSVASAQQLADWCKAAHQAWVGQVEWSQYQLPTRPAAAPSAAAVAATRDRPWQYERTLQAGELVATNARRQLDGQIAYTVDLGGGMTGVYIQHGDDNRYSKMGRLTIYRDGYQGTAAEIAGALDQFRRLGLDVRLATRDDLEVVYLQKQAHAMRLEDDADWQEALRRADAEPTTRGKLGVLRDFFAVKLGVQDVTKLKSYRPEPRFDSGWNPSSGAKADSPAGRPYWTRFDMTEAELKREMRGYGLTHSLSGATVSQFLERVLAGNGWLSNTEERIRIGVFRGEGMSPEQDMRTGGASYVFTRIGQLSHGTHGHLVFDPKLLLRTDLISYDGDMYGRSDPATKRRRNVSVEEWKRAARHGSNEAIIKNGVSLVDNLIQINTGSPYERDRVLDLLRSHGITRINGRDVEEVVR